MLNFLKKIFTCHTKIKINNSITNKISFNHNFICDDTDINQYIKIINDLISCDTKKIDHELKIILTNAVKNKNINLFEIDNIGYKAGIWTKKLDNNIFYDNDRIKKNILSRKMYIHIILGNYDKALRKLIKLKNHSSMWYRTYIELLLKTKNFSETEKSIEEMLLYAELYSSDDEFKNNELSGIIFSIFGDYHKAILFFNKVLVSDINQAKKTLSSFGIKYCELQIKINKLNI